MGEVTGSSPVWSTNMNLQQHWDTVDPLIALAVFVAYFIVDALYARYTLHVNQYKASSAATTGALMHFILAFGVLNYVQNYLYVIPLAVGSWLGTYAMVRLEKHKSTT